MKSHKSPCVPVLLSPSAFIRQWVKAAVFACTKRGQACPSSDNAATLHFFTVAVLVQDKREYDPSLEQVLYDITEGSCIGECSKLGSRRLTKKETHAALIAVGNDGGYFENF